MDGVDDIEKQLEYLWSNFQCNPQWMSMSLGNFRKFIAPRDDLREDAKQLLERAKNLPDSTLVFMTPGKIWLEGEG